MTDNVEKIRGELEKARRNLQHTVTEVNRKVESIGEQLQPTQLIERNIGVSVWLAGVLGFSLGGADGTFGALLLGVVLGAAINEARHDATGNNRDRVKKS